MLTTISATLRLAGIFAFSCGLFACGQPNVMTANAPVRATSASPQLQSTQPTQAPIAASPITSNSKSDHSSAGYSAETIYAEFERLAGRACQKREKVVRGTRYALCTMTDSQGVVRPVHASSSLVDSGDGVGYWLNESGDIYAIRYFHSGKVVVLLPEDKRTIVELVGNREIKVITDESRWNGLELGARDQIMTIYEQVDSIASTPQPSDNSDRQDVEQVALRSMNNGATAALTKATIQKLAIVDDTALLSWQRGETGGMMLLRKEQGVWLVLTSGGGAINLMTLSEYNVPRTTGQALLEQLNLN
jgi:hypothetical protein